MGGGYAPPQPGYPQPGYAPPQPGYPQPGYAPMQQPMPQAAVVVVSQPGMMVGGLGAVSPTPMTVTCPNCRLMVTTNVSYDMGLLAWLICLLLCFLGCAYALSLSLSHTHTHTHTHKSTTRSLTSHSFVDNQIASLTLIVFLRVAINICLAFKLQQSIFV